MVSESSGHGEKTVYTDDSPDMFVGCSPLEEEEISSDIKIQIEG
jgi:hypothetical protein